MMEDTLADRRIKKLLTPPKQPTKTPPPTKITDTDTPAPNDQVASIFGNELVQELRDRYAASVARNKKVRESVSQNIVWMPHEGPQQDFLASSEYEVLFCGGRNSGKSDCLLIDPIRFIDPVQYPMAKEFRGLIIRRTMPALREIIRRAKDLYPQIAPGVKWKDQEKMFVFPSGATIEMGYFDHMDDYDRYHGREFTWVGIDEISQFEDREYYDKIKSVARSTADGLPVRIRSTTNPSGPGRLWIKDYFMDAGKSNVPIITEVSTPIGKIKIARKYIKSTIFDNPTALEKDPQYVAYLASLPEIQRRQWLDGDFDAAEGLAFEDFVKDKHVVEPFEVPHSWTRIRAIDWGFRSKAVCLWMAVDYDSNIYVYREYVTTGVTADKFAANILALESGERIQYGVIDGGVAVTSGISGPTVEEEMIREGLVNIHADKRSGSRIHGKNIVHKYLYIDPELQEPRLKIFSSCPQLVKELSSLLVDKHNPEDVDTKMEDHAYDALRYGLMSRPLPYAPDFSTAYGLGSGPIALDSKFGY